MKMLQTQGDDTSPSPERRTSHDAHGDLRMGPAQQTVIKRPRRKSRDRSNENFQKRWRTLIKIGWELNRDYGADTYFSVRRQNRDFVFRSSEGVSPLLAADAVRASKPTAAFNANIREGKALPPTSTGHGAKRHEH
jgi:hypothetical protein